MKIGNGHITIGGSTPETAALLSHPWIVSAHHSGRRASISFSMRQGNSLCYIIAPDPQGAIVWGLQREPEGPIEHGESPTLSDAYREVMAALEAAKMTEDA